MILVFLFGNFFSEFEKLYYLYKNLITNVIYSQYPSLHCNSCYNYSLVWL